MVVLVALAAAVGYRGFRTVQINAQDLVREHLVMSGRAAELEERIEAESEELFRESAWILGGCCVLAVAFSILTIRITNGAFQRVEWQSQELSRVSWSMLRDQETVARRFSHEMHDELGQSLTALRSMMKRLGPNEFEHKRTECVEILDQVLANVRELSQLLRPVILDDFGLDASLRWLAAGFTQRTQIEVEYTSDFDGRLSGELETQLFRIAQEALTNVARHSGATQAWIALKVSQKNIQLKIEDNGHGLTPGHAVRVETPSLGMVGMRARARQLEGDLFLQPSAFGGLLVRVEAPLGEEADAVPQETSHSVS
jgi:signal transduction histidine kinase